MKHLFLALFLILSVASTAALPATPVAAQDVEADKTEIPAETVDVCTDEVCAERQPPCQYGWNGVSFCAQRPILSSVEVYPLVHFKMSKNAIEHSRGVRFRICADSPQAPDSCGSWFRATVTRTSKAGQWFSAMAPYTTDNCQPSRDDAVAEAYYTQAMAVGRGSDGSTNSSPIAESQSNTAYTMLDC